MSHFGVVFYLFPNLNFSKMSQTFFYVFTWVMKIHRQKRAQMHDCIHEYCTAHILIMFQWISMNFIMLHWSSPMYCVPNALLHSYCWCRNCTIRLLGFGAVEAPANVAAYLLCWNGKPCLFILEHFYSSITFIASATKCYQRLPFFIIFKGFE